jgi:hypothetical protein
MNKRLLLLPLLLSVAAMAGPALAQGGAACQAPGEPIHWRVDYCMLKMETDDEIAVSGCMEEEGKRRFANGCAGNLHFKRRMCELVIRYGTRTGTADQCVKDPEFKGRTVRMGGVGG